MSPFAGVYGAMVAHFVVWGLLAGFVCGALTSMVRINVILGGLLASVAYAVSAILIERPHAFAVLWGWGAVPLSEAFLSSYVSARYLEIRFALHRVWAGLLGIVCAVGSCFALAFVFRMIPRGPFVGGAILDVSLILVLIRDGRLRQR